MAFRFEHLIVWQDSREFCSSIYTITKSFPKEEFFSLTDQLKRAAGSVSANIAEGAGSSSKKDFAHFLDIAIKSLYEVISHLYIAQDQKYITNSQRQELYNQAEKLVKQLKSLRKSLLP
jgi:four helix bundle protein